MNELTLARDLVMDGRIHIECLHFDIEYMASRHRIVAITFRSNSQIEHNRLTLELRHKVQAFYHQISISHLAWLGQINPAPTRYPITHRNSSFPNTTPIPRTRRAEAPMLLLHARRLPYSDSKSGISVCRA